MFNTFMFNTAMFNDTIEAARFVRRMISQPTVLTTILEVNYAQTVDNVTELKARPEVDYV